VHGRAGCADHAPVTTPDDTDRDDEQGGKPTPRQLAIADLRAVMGTKQGRRFMHRLLAQAGIDQRSFTGNSETFFREGRRAVALELQDDIRTHAFPEYVLMLQEAKAK